MAIHHGHHGSAPEPIANFVINRKCAGRLDDPRRLRERYLYPTPIAQSASALTSLPSPGPVRAGKGIRKRRFRCAATRKR
jgi:hypothetical protein